VCLGMIPVATGADNAPGDGDWPQWRGPRRDGISTDTGLVHQWPKGGPPLVWEAKGAGRGYASVAIAAGKLYTMGDHLSTAADEDESASCFDLSTGKQLWKAKLGPAWNEGGQESRQSSRSTPTVDGDRVYFLTARGDLACLETASGKPRWRKNLKNDFGGRK